MFTATATATGTSQARATASIATSCSVTSSSSATSNISQEDANNIAIINAQKDANELALLNANKIANDALSGNNELIIISALEEEFLSNYNNNEKIKISLITNSPLPTYRVITNDAECLYIVSGVGKANSASSIMYAINGLGAKKIIWFGTSASATLKLNINDVAIIKRAIYLDANYTAFGLPLGEMYGEDLFQYTSENFSNLNYNLLKQDNILKIFNDITSGTCDQFVINFDLIDLFPKDYDIALVDCENTSSLQISNSFDNIQICTIRYVSDNLIDPTEGQLQTFDKTLILSSLFFRNYFYKNLLIIKKN